MRTGLPGDANIDLFTLPDLLSRGRALEAQIDWSSLRSLRDIQSQVQHLPITSPTFQKLQKTLALVDAWRRDFQRVVSLMKSSTLESSDGDKSSSHRRNVVVSGQSGFLKDLFSGGASSCTDGGASEELETRPYSQSQTVGEAVALLDKGLELSIQCEEVTQLQGWVSECETWSNSVREALGIVDSTPQLHSRCDVPLPPQSWNIDGLRELQRYFLF